MNVNNQYNLQELFKELKEKEGVESIDDVLKKVISPNGISFNEIKPVYRELLLKLAMTMSQDELFQRSKNIMSAEKKKTTKKKDKASKKSYPVSASEQSTLSSFLKLTFSSNKHQNGMGTEKSSTFTKDSKKSISKTDISGPMPIHPPPSLGRKTPKTTRKANIFTFYSMDQLDLYQDLNIKPDLFFRIPPGLFLLDYNISCFSIFLCCIF